MHGIPTDDPVYTTGVLGDALDMTNRVTNRYVALPVTLNNTLETGGHDYGFCAWIDVSGTVLTDDLVIMANRPFVDNSAGWILAVQKDTNKVYVLVSDGTTSVTVIDTVAIPAGAHVCVVMLKSLGVMRLYVNNVMTASASLGVAFFTVSLASGSGAVYVGQDSTTTYASRSGFSLDELVFFFGGYSDKHYFKVRPAGDVCAYRASLTTPNTRCQRFDVPTCAQGFEGPIQSCVPRVSKCLTDCGHGQCMLMRGEYRCICDENWFNNNGICNFNARAPLYGSITYYRSSGTMTAGMHINELYDV